MAKNLRRTDIRLKIIPALLGVISVLSMTDARAVETFLPPMPESEFLSLVPEEPTVDFCSEWNPEFAHRGHRCCSDSFSKNVLVSTRRRSMRHLKARCAPGRIKSNFCDEMTDEQRAYMEGVKSRRIKDPLKYLEARFDRYGQQAWCGTTNGFLVAGKPLIETPENRIELRNAARCANFGTDRLVAMMEWVGREVHKEYHEPEFSRARVIVGDLSAPRGSCMSGRFGTRAHKSHTTGLDLDMAFFNPRFAHPPEERFTRTFYVASNWWFLKKVFSNPYACVRVVFLDARHKQRLERFAKTDPEWEKLAPYIRHIKGHKDHFHIRVGESAGAPGCLGQGASESDEEISDADTADVDSVEGAGEGDEESGLLPAGVAENEDPSGTPVANSLPRTIAQKTGEFVARALGKTANAAPEAPEEFRLAHKQEPSITQRIDAEMRPKRSKRRRVAGKRKSRK